MEGVLEHRNLRCLVNLMGKVLWPGSRSSAFGRRRVPVTKTSLAVWALRVIVPNNHAHVHVRFLSHHGSCQHNHSYQMRHQTPLIREDISSFLLDIREPVTSEESSLTTFTIVLDKCEVRCSRWLHWRKPLVS